jgi:hypothetical protein
MASGEDKARAVIQDILVEKSIKACLIKHGISAQSFYELLNANPTLANQYARAQQAKVEFYADEIIEISDTEEDANKARVRVDARKWIASKLSPAKYGERIDLNVNSNVDLNIALAEAKRRALPSSYQEQATDAILAESPRQLAQAPTGCEPVVDIKDKDADIFS